MRKERAETPLATLRRAYRLSQMDLARLIGVIQPTVSQIESGKQDPDMATIISIADTLGVPLDYLRADVKAPKQAGDRFVTTFTGAESRRGMPCLYVVYHAQQEPPSREWIQKNTPTIEDTLPEIRSRESLRADRDWRRDVGKNIEKHRITRTISIATMAAKCGVSETNIEHVESGDAIPDFSLLVSIADALEITVNALVGITKNIYFHENVEWIVSSPRGNQIKNITSKSTLRTLLIRYVKNHSESSAETVIACIAKRDPKNFTAWLTTLNDGDRRLMTKIVERFS